MNTNITHGFIKEKLKKIFGEENFLFDDITDSSCAIIFVINSHIKQFIEKSEDNYTTKCVKEDRLIIENLKKDNKMKPNA